MRFVPTTTARRGALHLRLHRDHLHTLCGQRARYDTVNDRAAIVCQRCAEIARSYVRVGL